LKKSPSTEGSALRPPQSYPHQLYRTATKRSNFVAHKKSILIIKILCHFSASFLCALHFTWFGDGTDRIHSRGKKNECIGVRKILILPKAIQIYVTKSARRCGRIPSSYGSDRINNSDQ